MSEPRLISPLLENHLMGDPISDHDGVCCCPAILKDSDKRFIVKIISIPASQTKLDALLLSGAYQSNDDALNYFKSLTEDVIQEAQLLQKLSKLEGFISYDGWQVEPMDDGVGYDVYLIGSYRRTLERHLRLEPLTHLAAVNLGLDLCAALSVCRRNGYLYVDLKPGNVFVTENNEYRIGDLGFISLKSLKYASLPDKYRSAYTAPEVTDAYSALNTTLDIYAAGLILYQVFNNSDLPDMNEPLAPPAYADYEMAEIILKACAADPEDRWQDPQEMGQALVSYMQRNTVNDTPIIPPPIPEPEIDEPEETGEELPDEAAISEEAVIQEPVDEVQVEENSVSEPETEEPVEQIVDDIPESEIAQSDDRADATEEPVQPEETDEMEQFIIDGFQSDETTPSEEIIADMDQTVLTEEVSQMLAEADELIAHKTPDPVVAPEPIEVPMPEPIRIEPESDDDADSLEDTESEGQPESAAEEPAEEVEDTAEEESPVELPPAPAAGTKRKAYSRLIGILSAVLIALLIGLGAFYYYENYYLQSISDITLDGEDNQLTVILDTQIDNSLLTVICTDTYGNTLHKEVTDNTAVFTDLSSGTTYKISVVIDGFHELIGTTSATHTTATQTNIVSFTAVAGDTNGSVILNFSVQGPDNSNWYVKYSAEGESEKTALCTGHMAMITGLTPGSVYTFRLVPETELYVVGADCLEYTATNLIYAENLTLSGYNSGALMVDWDITEGETVDNWTVRCYNSDGFDTTITVNDTCAAIEGLDPAQSYTIDVKAGGMTVSRWISITANSITFKEILLDDSVDGQLTVSWDYEGVAPEEGWRLMYTIDGSEKYIVQCEEPTCTISPLVPGAHYSFSFQLAEDITVFGGTAEYDVPLADNFGVTGVSADNISFRMCWTPDNTGWRWYDMWEEDFTTAFAVGEKASFVLSLNVDTPDSNTEISTLFVVKNSEGIPVSITEGRTRSWNEMWYKGYTELDIPVMPQIAGSYTVDIYFNGAYISTESFTVS